jgi:hypothetical protein
MPIKFTIEMTDEAVEALGRGLSGNSIITAAGIGAGVVEAQAKAARTKKTDAKAAEPAATAEVGSTPAQAAAAKTVKDLVDLCRGLTTKPGNTQPIVLAWFKAAAQTVTGAVVANPGALAADKVEAVYAEIVRLSTPVETPATTDSAADLFPG